MNNPKLSHIRDAKTFADLKPAIKYLCDNMQAMAWGDFVAYKRTLEAQAVKVGASVVDLNKYAENYQVYGYEVSNG